MFLRFNKLFHFLKNVNIIKVDEEVIATGTAELTLKQLRVYEQECALKDCVDDARMWDARDNETRSENLTTMVAEAAQLIERQPIYEQALETKDMLEVERTFRKSVADVNISYQFNFFYSF